MSGEYIRRKTSNTGIGELVQVNSDVPLYKEVRRRILRCLAKGEWKPGEKIPTEPKLAERFGVAVSTIRAGVGELTAAGVLIRHQGKGTFVARHDFHSQQFRFSNIYNSEKEKVSTTREIVSMRKIRANVEISKMLALDLREAPYVHRIDAILKIEGKPVALMDLILPLPLFSSLKQEHLEQTEENLYFVYQRQCGVIVLRMEERIYARTADVQVAKVLQVKKNHPVMIVERTAFTFNDIPVEIRRRTYEGLEHHYVFTHDRLD